MRLLLACLFTLAALAQEVVPGRFIVELTDGAQPAARRTTMRAQFAARQWRVRGSLQMVANALLVEAPDAAALSRMAGVKRVTPVERWNPFLYRAVLTHEAAAGWDAAGGSLKAGAGVKIAIIDTGIESSHPGFQAPDLTVPEGFPKADSDANLALTNHKIIVARSYDGSPASDTIGHGTAVAMAAAGVSHTSPKGTISGFAPAAWLGVYRASNLDDGYFYSDTVLLALDDAALDGMDIINLSFGSIGKTGATSNLYAEVLDRLTAAGILVVNAAGNTPGAMTVDDRSSHPKVLAVGANAVAPSILPAVMPSVGKSMDAASTDGYSGSPIAGPMTTLLPWDSAEQGCQPYPGAVMTGYIPLILAGGCDVQVKLSNAQAAGAPAAVIYSDNTSDPEAVVLIPASNPPVIPALSVGNSDGLKLKDYILTLEDFQVQLRFPYGGKTPTGLASFSSSGPSVELAIKPDLVATGAPLYTAAKRASYDPVFCPVCDTSGYVGVLGTSLSAPLVAGAAAVLKAARPGLSPDEYRSLLVNGTTPFVVGGTTLPVNAAGAGYLNLRSSVTSTLAAVPLSVSFGSGGSTVDLVKSISLKNVGTATATYTLSVDSTDAVVPAISQSNLTLAAGEAASVDLHLTGTDLAAGAWQGFVRVTDTSGQATRIPYWYAVEGGAPASITVVAPSDLSAKAGSNLLIYFRVHDAAGLALPNADPVVTATSPEGSVKSLDKAFQVFPNCWALTVELGGESGTALFQIEAGTISQTISVNVLP